MIDKIKNYIKNVIDISFDEKEEELSINITLKSWKTFKPKFVKFFDWIKFNKSEKTNIEQTEESKNT